MLSAEQFNHPSSGHNKAPVGLLFLLTSSLLHGASVVSGSPCSAEVATVERPAVQRINKTTQVKPQVGRQTNNRQVNKKATRGQASWYGPGFHGKKTASGEIFDQGKLTAAHKTLPLGTKAKVTNLENGNTVEVEINDRGPYVGQRVIDLSRAAANALGFVESGLTLVRIEPLPEESGREEAG